jgi:hypothetical protein
MTPLVKYSLARLGLFVIAAVALLFMPVPIDPLLKLMIALLVSALAGYFLLSRMRVQVGEQMAASMERRAERKERLRSALAGDDDKAGDKQDG